MATATRVSQPRSFGSPEIAKTNAGWVGSKAGKRGDFVQVSGTGYIDQAAAAGAAVAGTVDVAMLNQKVASTVAADSTTAKAVRMRKFQDSDLIELQLVNNSDTRVDVTAAMVGDALGIYRLSTGDYAADQNGTSHLIVKRVNTTRNTVLCAVIEANRLK